MSFYLLLLLILIYLGFHDGINEKFKSRRKRRKKRRKKKEKKERDKCICLRKKCEAGNCSEEEKIFLSHTTQHGHKDYDL